MKKNIPKKKIEILYDIFLNYSFSAKIDNISVWVFIYHYEYINKLPEMKEHNINRNKFQKILSLLNTNNMLINGRRGIYYISSNLKDEEIFKEEMITIKNLVTNGQSYIMPLRFNSYEYIRLYYQLLGFIDDGLFYVFKYIMTHSIKYKEKDMYSSNKYILERMGAEIENEIILSSLGSENIPTLRSIERFINKLTELEILKRFRYLQDIIPDNSNISNTYIIDHPFTQEFNQFLEDKNEFIFYASYFIKIASTYFDDNSHLITDDLKNRNEQLYLTVLYMLLRIYDIPVSKMKIKIFECIINETIGNLNKYDFRLNSTLRDKIISYSVCSESSIHKFIDEIGHTPLIKKTGNLYCLNNKIKASTYFYGNIHNIRVTLKSNFIVKENTNIDIIDIEQTTCDDESLESNTKKLTLGSTKIEINLEPDFTLDD